VARLCGPENFALRPKFAQDHSNRARRGNALAITNEAANHEETLVQSGHHIQRESRMRGRFGSGQFFAIVCKLQNNGPRARYLPTAFPQFYVIPPTVGPNSIGDEVSVSVIRRMEVLNSKNASTLRNFVAAIEGHHVGTSLGTRNFAHIAEHLDVQKRTRGLGLRRQSSYQNVVTKKPDGVAPSGQSTRRRLHLKSAGVNPLVDTLLKDKHVV
jgi:hypothetical protein